MKHFSARETGPVLGHVGSRVFSISIEVEDEDVFVVVHDRSRGRYSGYPFSASEALELSELLAQAATKVRP